MSVDPTWIDVLSEAELPAGGQKSVLVRGARVLLCRTESGALHAVADLCPHALQPLEGGRLRGGTLRCPRHGACFDLASGQPVNPVTDRPLTVFPVRAHHGRIEVASSS
ncbi:MAG TPA: Rieske (2Fe-2S) protein [Nevskiaceae bacterium]|nr:Rieske (2Fe-2S) protein [Nevskiaceae bacterium]